MAAVVCAPTAFACAKSQELAVLPRLALVSRIFAGSLARLDPILPQPRRAASDALASLAAPA